MDLNLIKKLIKAVETSEITDFFIEEGDLKIKISKKPAPVIQSAPQYIEAKLPQTQNETTASVQASPEQKEAKPEIPAANLHEVRSPIVGTFYRAPAPDADSYVNVGDKVSEGNVLCIIEAMKLMNEIESDATGKIVKILVENATAVEYNQPLFLIEKN
ncbi:MAG: acetyl-CoA carboxylase biotin carboxyl carrier protein [Melioribacteraceae bacterium]|nr:acetyl-CoA carboxylase biotin carboxyl carrier protein [Melioribacteraceae bacterium]